MIFGVDIIRSLSIRYQKSTQKYRYHGVKKKFKFAFSFDKNLFSGNFHNLNAMTILFGFDMIHSLSFRSQKSVHRSIKRKLNLCVN